MRGVQTRRRRRGGGPTIADVARRAAVSPMTVSRVINGGSAVSDETRRRVNEAVQALGYAPDPAARTLAGARTVRIGLLYSNPSAGWLSEVLLGAMDECGRQHLPLLIERCEGEGDELPALERLLGSGADAVLLPPPLCEHPPLIRRLEAEGVLAAALAGDGGGSLSSVRIDDLAAARTMTEHLIGLGHRRIGFVRGHPNQSASALRFEGYAQALADAGLAVEPELVAEGRFDFRSGLDAADRLLRLDPRPSAVFASNDDMAAAVVAAAHRAGLDVPRDLAVVGFDDTAMAVNVWPTLTTVRQPVQDMARRAVALLAERLRDSRAGRSAEPAHERAAFGIVIRESAASPKAER